MRNRTRGQSCGIEAVIFDLDGLLVDSEPLYFAACRDAIAWLGHDLSQEDYDLHLCGRPNVAAEEYFLGKLPRGFDRAAFRGRWLDGFRRRIESGELAAKPGAERLLAESAAGGLRRAVATGSDRADAELMLAATGLGAWIEDVVAAEDVARGKPAPDAFLEAARRVDCAPPACVALEDSPAGIRAAAAAGMRLVVVPDRIAPDPEVVCLASCAVVCADLCEAADVVAGWRRA